MFFKKSIKRELKEIKELIKENNLKTNARLDSLKTDNETRFNELCKRSDLADEVIELNIKLKDTTSVKEKYEKEALDYKETVKNLTSEINTLKKKIKQLEKENQKYKDEGIKIPKRLAPAVPRTGQKMKETVRPVKGGLN